MTPSHVHDKHSYVGTQMTPSSLVCIDNARHRCMPNHCSLKALHLLRGARQGCVWSREAMLDELQEETNMGVSKVLYLLS